MDVSFTQVPQLEDAYGRGDTSWIYKMGRKGWIEERGYFSGEGKGIIIG